MNRQDSSKQLRQRAIEYLNSPYQIYKKKAIQVNNQLSDKQKMIIIKRLTSENEKFSFDIPYSLKSYKKHSFHSSNYSISLNKSPEYINSSNSIPTKQINQQNSLKDVQDILNKKVENNHKESYRLTSSVEPKDNIKDPQIQKNHSQLNLCHKNQNDNDIHANERFSINNQDQTNRNQDQQQLITTDNQIKQENEFKTQQKQNLPLILSKEYKELNRNNSKKHLLQKNTRGNYFNYFESNSQGQTPQRQSLKNNQFLFNQIIYQQITHSQPTDPFTDDVDEYSVLRKRKNQELFSTKISKIKPPSQVNTLIQKGCSYFFEKSPKYKSDFLITPKQTMLSKENKNNSQNKNDFVYNQFSDVTKNIHSACNEEVYLEEKDSSTKIQENVNESQQNQQDNAIKTQYDSMITSQKSNFNLSSTQILNKNYIDKKTNNFTNKMGKNQITQNCDLKNIKSEYYNENQQNQQQITNEAKIFSEANSIYNNNSSIKADNDGFKTLDTDKENNQEQSLSKTFSLFSLRQNNIENKKHVIKSNQDDSKGNIQFNNSKLIPQIDVLRCIERDPIKRSNSFHKQQSQRERLLIGDYGEFQYGALTDRVSYNKFKYQIGENEKNIKTITKDGVSPNKIQSLPKSKIVNTKLLYSESPVLGQYDLNLSTLQTNKGLKFSVVQKNQMFKSSQNNEKLTLAVQKKDQQELKEETSEQYFNKLMNEIKRDVEKQTSQAGQTYLRANSIQELNSIDQNVFDRYTNEISQKFNQCKDHLNTMKQWLKKEDDIFKKQ